MTPAQALVLKSLLEDQSVAALATLQEGEPALSMVPCALLPHGKGFILHVSGMAAHTAQMRAHPSVSLMVMAPLKPGESPLALPRVSVQGTARPWGTDAPDYALAKSLYQARFPESEMTFALGDFSIFVVEPRSLRFVGGFGQAHTLSAQEFASLMGN